jgi:hypothetical protein
MRSLPAVLVLACAALAPLAGCAPRGAATPPQPAQATTPADADLATLVRRLQVYHPTEDCTELGQGLADPRATFVRAVDEVANPPWVGLMAGSCVARHHAAAEEARIATWLTDDRYRGLGRTVLREFAVIPEEPVVLRLGALALQGSSADLAAELLAADPRPAVRALVPQAAAEAPVAPETPAP